MILKKLIAKTVLIIVFSIQSLLCLAQETQPIKQNYNEALHNKLPTNIIESKKIVVVNDGQVPPYLIRAENDSFQGASIDFINAIAQLLGIEIEHQTVGGLSALLTGVTNGRYDMAIGPISDLPSRQANADFIDYAVSYSALLVPKGNPLAINTLEDMCGKQISNPIGSSGEEKLKLFSQECVKQGKAEIIIQNFKDQPTAILAVKSGRADAFFGGIAILSHYVSEAKDELQLSATKEPGSIPERYYAAMVAKDSPLGPVLLAAFQELHNNGSYQKIMKKWGLESSTLNEIGMNLAK